MLYIFYVLFQKAKFYSLRFFIHFLLLLLLRFSIEIHISYSFGVWVYECKTTLILFYELITKRLCACLTWALLLHRIMEIYTYIIWCMCARASLLFLFTLFFVLLLLHCSVCTFNRWIVGALMHFQHPCSQLAEKKRKCKEKHKKRIEKWCYVKRRRLWRWLKVGGIVYTSERNDLKPKAKLENVSHFRNFVFHLCSSLNFFLLSVCLFLFCLLCFFSLVVASFLVFVFHLVSFCTSLFAIFFLPL